MVQILTDLFPRDSLIIVFFFSYLTLTFGPLFFYLDGVYIGFNCQSSKGHTSGADFDRFVSQRPSDYCFFFISDLDLWPTTLTYNPNLVRSYKTSRSNGSNGRARTHRQMDGRYQVHYILASQLEIHILVTKAPYNNYTCKVPVFQCKIVMNILLMEVDQFR